MDQAGPDGCGLWRSWRRGEAGDGAVAKVWRESGKPVLERSIHCLGVFNQPFERGDIDGLAQTLCYLC